MPKRLIRGVSERVDCFGEDRGSAERGGGRERDPRAGRRRRARRSRSASCGRSAIPTTSGGSATWSAKIAPDVFVTCSVDIAPKWGEYERVTATALNAYLGPVMSGYLSSLDFELKGLGYPQRCRSPSAAAARCRWRAARSAAADARLRPGVRRHRLDVPRRGDGREEHHHHRHGRHLVRRRRSSPAASPPTPSSATPTSTSTSCPRSTCRRSAPAAAAWCASEPAAP